MIHIEVDYEGPRSIETSSFAGTGADYQAKLDEIEKYEGKIDRIRVYIGTNKVSAGVFDQIGRDIKVNTTNVGVALRKARQIKY